MRFGYTFPAIRGVQANREYFTSMCPLRLIPKIFLFDEDEAELSPELRAQRTLNRGRVPDMADYLLRNRDNYVFSALTASIDGDVQFESLGEDGHESLVGLLRVPMDSKFIINDGQHRRAAIEEALRQQPDLGDESIAVVFFLDPGLQRCQQMFADLNRHGIRPSKSLGVLYDHRDDMAKLVRLTVLKSKFLKDLVEMERSNLSPRSRKLFTLSALYHATDELLKNIKLNDQEEAAERAIEFWEAVAAHMPEWKFVKKRQMSSGEVRKDFIHSHGIAIHSLGRVGNALMRRYPKNWKAKLKGLDDIDWSRSNSKVWEGRAMIGGRVSKAQQNLILTSNLIKHYLNLELTPEEERLERAFQGASDERASSSGN
ncbi:DNA sulfur modification protein DndB [Natronospira proteinivora]|nr:DNA sulfur modification protein DndB [Natronospira proteinivora]